ncbi:hypothetical protein FQN54_008726 [Arachnomyces sp. PD_36]|nr:hypothetical protein FQN54_008726 [Arachnomyces sp. PD_36]
MDQSQPAQTDNASTNADAGLTGAKGPETFSDNPFDDNYRHQLDMENPEQRETALHLGFTPEILEYYRSAEYAELSRPFDQYRWLLKERGLMDKYNGLGIGLIKRTPEELYECEKNFLKEEAPDLIERFEKLHKIVLERAEAVQRGERIIPDLPVNTGPGSMYHKPRGIRE